MTAAEKMIEQHVQKLREQVQRLESEMRSLQDKRSGLLLAISVLTDEPASADSEIKPAVRQVRLRLVRQVRLPLKDIVLRMVDAHAEHGIVAADIIELGKKEGLDLDRNSVSSLLSRFKRDGVLSHDGGRYRPKRPFPHEVKDTA